MQHDVTQSHIQQIPRALETYPSAADQSLATELATRVGVEPFNAVATAIFVVAILHTFAAAWFTKLAHRVEERHHARTRASGEPLKPSLGAAALHYLGEVEVVFGLWALVLIAAIVGFAGWGAAKHYVNDTVNYTEPLFVVVIMALAATRPIILFAESTLRQVAAAGGGTPAAWWMSILVFGPLLGSFITEPAAMTISALLLARQFYDLRPSPRLMYATLGLLFVNVSIGGVLTPFAAPPVLMVARPWGWDMSFMLTHFGWRAALAIVLSTGNLYFLFFSRELDALASKAPVPDVDQPQDVTAPLLPVPPWVVVVHIGFMMWTVFTAHYPAFFLGGFIFFLGFVRATLPYQGKIELKTPLLVGFFLAGLVIHGGLQAWWIAPVLRRLSETPLFIGATLLTAINDNALITYLATLVPNLSDNLKIAVVGGAVTGGGLTVIANAPNPAGQALLSRFFGGSISPLKLFLAAVVPTAITALVFRLL